MTQRHTLVLGLLAVSAMAATPSWAADATLSLRFRDSGGTQLAVRATVLSAGVSRFPTPAASGIYQTPSTGSYFYSGGNSNVVVSTGQVTIRASRGFEYQVLDTTITVTSSRTLTFRINRLINMKDLGWFSGDTHVHISHPPNVYTLDGDDLALIARCEELNVINAMEEQPYFTGQLHPSSTSDRLVYFSKEQRNAHFSHVGILGLRQWIPDSGCGPTGLACGATLDQLIHAQVHAQSGQTAVIATHPFATFDTFNFQGWPGVGMWRGMSLDLPAGAVDAMDLLTYSNATPPSSIEPYFHMLNAGFRVAPSAGTDCSLGSGVSPPAGGFRVYVDPVGAFNFDNWISAFKQGRSFVTNYPLITNFAVEGARSGDVLTYDGATLHGTISVVCRLPIQRVEIYGDMGLIEVLIPPGGMAKSFTSSFAVGRSGLTWLVARVTGAGSSPFVMSANGLFAQTAPVFIESTSGPGQGSFARAQAAEYFLARLAETEAVFNQSGTFPNNTRAAFDLAVASARAFYESLASSPTDADTPSLPSDFALRNVWPNPSGGDVHIDYLTPSSNDEHSISIYDAAGRRVTTLFAGRRPSGSHQVAWDGRDAHGKRVASGVYFVRMHANGASVSRKFVLLR